MSELLEAGAIVPAALLNAVLDRVGPFTSAEVDDLDTDFPYPFTGQIVHVADIDCDVRWNGTAWEPVSGAVEEVASSAGTTTVSATNWATAQTVVSKDVELPFAAVMRLTIQTDASTPGASSRIYHGIEVAGATTITPESGNTPALQTDSPVHGERIVELNAGTNTLRFKAYRTGSNNGTLYVPRIGASFVRWV